MSGASRWLARRGHDRDRQLIRELGERRDLKAFGGVVVHDADCPHPEGPCNCDGGPLVLEPRRHARGLP